MAKSTATEMHGFKAHPTITEFQLPGQADPNNLLISQPSPATGLSLKVVMVFQDFATCFHALLTFDHLFLNDRCNLSARSGTRNIWSFRHLDAIENREAAADETFGADMVFVSLHGSTDLPAGVKNWIELWIEKRLDGPGVMVALVDEASPDRNEQFPSEIYLEQCARRAGMDYVIQKVSERHCPDDCFTSGNVPISPQLFTVAWESLFNKKVS